MNKKQGLGRVVPPSFDEDRNVPLSTLINLGPVTLAEFREMGFETLDQLDELGFEAVCRLWVDHYPERLNTNAFIGVLALFEGIKWTKVTPSQRNTARALVNTLRAELGLPPVKASRRK